MKRLIFFLLSAWISGCAYAQSGVPFNGIVMDAGGLPVKRVKVYVSDPRKYALTDKKGRFGLTDVQAADTLHVLWRKVIYLVPVDNKRSVKIYIAGEHQVRAEEDQELVDLGYGFTNRREHVGVSNGISGDELRKSGYTDILSALQGRVAGLNISSGGQPGRESAVSMRGQNSFYADQTPLFIIDGTIVDSFMGLNMADVDYVEIMKDASIYGSRGANGAILVRTKRGGSK